MSVIKDVKGVDKRSMVAAERPDIFGAGSWCNERKKEIDLKCSRQCKWLIIYNIVVQMFSI